jgi:hypothetical protein
MRRQFGAGATERRAVGGDAPTGPQQRGVTQDPHARQGRHLVAARDRGEHVGQVERVDGLDDPRVGLRPETQVLVLGRAIIRTTGGTERPSVCRARTSRDR